MYADNSREEMSRTHVIGQAVALNRLGHRYFKATAATARAVAACETFKKTHRPVGDVPLTEVSSYLAYIALIPAVYALDVLVFGAPMQFVARRLAGETFFMALAAKYGAPGAFLMIEIMIANLMEQARLAERFAFGSEVARRAWLALGILVTLVMPVAAWGVAAAAGAAAADDLSPAILAALTIVSFAGHAVVLFSGRAASTAKAFVGYTASKVFLTKRVEVREDRKKATLAHLNGSFIFYVHSWSRHNEHYAPLPSGPFDAEVVELLKSQFPHVAGGPTSGGPLATPEDEP